MKLTAVSLKVFLVLLAFVAIPAFPADTAEVEIAGRIIDSASRAIPNASVTIVAVREGDRTTYGRVETTAVTDANGRFVLRTQADIDCVDVLVIAKGFARQRAAGLRRFRQNQAVILKPAMSIRGRVVGSSGPVAKAPLKLVQADRNVLDFLGEYITTTNAEGRFEIYDVTPGIKYVLGGTMKRWPGAGAPFVKTVETSLDARSVDLGDLHVEQGFLLDGRLVGASAPRSTRIFLSRIGFYDAIEAEVGLDNRFHFQNLPADSYRLLVKAPGIGLCIRNASLDPIYPAALVGRVDKDKRNLQVAVEKGETRNPPRLERLPSDKRQALLTAHNELMKMELRGVD